MATQKNGNVVQVFDTEQESEAMVVNGLLQSEGIEAFVVSLDAPQDVLPGVGGIVVRVPAEDADRALQIIQDYRVSGEAAAEEAELNAETSAMDETQ